LPYLIEQMSSQFEYVSKSESILTESLKELSDI
jgi:hypothetical protein